MSFLSKLAAISSAVATYGAAAAAIVPKVEAEVGPGNGQTKKQLAVAYILAAAHAGESVSVPQIQAIALAVDLVASIANSLGAMGKATTTTVVVPPAETAVVKP